MPVSLAEYGVSFFAVGVLAWVFVAVFAPRKKDPDLTRIIAENTQALTELTVLIKQQTELLQEQSKMLAEMRLDLVRGREVRRA